MTETNSMEKPKAETREMPVGWGTDKLSDFLDMAQGNTCFVFEQHGLAWARMKEIDEAFATVTAAAPRGFSAFFLLRCHSAFRAAVRVASSGQLPEGYALLRSTLEWALYSSYVHDDEARGRTWLSRHDGDAERKAVKQEFRVDRMIDTLAARSAAVGARTLELYNETIDFGAHPNERALTSSMRPEAEKGTFQLDYFTLQDSPALRLLLKRTCQVGVCCLDIFDSLWPERFSVLGVSEALPRLRRGL
jgi:hypothetical protein